MRLGPECFRAWVSAAATLSGTRFETTAVLAGECARPSEDADQTDRLSQRAVGVGGLVGTSGRMFGITSLGLSCSEAVQALRNVGHAGGGATRVLDCAHRDHTRAASLVGQTSH